MIWLRLLVLVLLMAIAWQDFHSRAVHWWLFPLLTALFISWQFVEQKRLNWEAIYWNMTFLILQFGLLTAYLSWKYGRFIQFWKGFLGWGDVCFILAIGFLLPFASFLIFYLVTLSCSVLIALFWMRAEGSGRSIPLAGEQSAWLALVIVFEFFYDPGLLFMDFGTLLWGQL